MKTPAKRSKTRPDASQRWGCTPRTIRRWKRAGAPLDDEAAMRHWLSAQRTLPEGTRRLLEAAPIYRAEAEERMLAAKSKAGKASGASRRGERTAVPNGTHVQKPRRSDDEAGRTGAPQALVRLEDAELRGWQRFEAATATGDLVAAKAARQAWLEVSRELRRYDLQVERERRQGDTVPRDDAEAVLQSLARTIRLELRESVLFAFAKVHPDSAAMKALESVLDAYLLAAASTVACRRMLDGSPLPAWVTNALEAELRNQFPQADLNEQATALSMILRSVLAQQVQAQATR